jgi:hypothetical protein
MKILVEVNDNKADYAVEFLKNISFIKKTRRIAKNEITNAAILQSIESYEKKKIKPTPVNLKELKAMIYA